MIWFAGINKNSMSTVLVVPSPKLLVSHHKQYSTYCSNWAFLAQRCGKKLCSAQNDFIFFTKIRFFNVVGYEVNRTMFLCWNNSIINNNSGEDIFLTLNHTLPLCNINYWDFYDYNLKWKTITIMVCSAGSVIA